FGSLTDFAQLTGKTTTEGAYLLVHKEGLGVTNKRGQTFENTTAATSGITIQRPPYFEYTGGAWVGGVAKTHKARIRYEPKTAGAPELIFEFDTGAGYGTDTFRFTDGGSMICSNISVSTGGTAISLSGSSPIILMTDSGGQILIGALKVLAARKTGWAAPTGTSTRTTFATSTVTLVQLAERVKALLEDLGSTSGHGLIDV
ncbi:MAG: hypothetical protein ACE5HI_13895, partial [bacterium]